MPFFPIARMIEANKRFHLVTEVVPGAETRGSSSFNPGCEVGHHTAGAKTGDRPSLHLCTVGRVDLDGPLCNDFLTRAGVAVIVACGRANHAGLGSFRGIIGNSGAWGIEAEDDGDGTWSDLQIVAYPRLVAARLWLINRDASWYVPHRVWGANPIGGGWAGRKIDPKGIIDEWMRAWVDALLKNPNIVPTRAMPGSEEIVMPLVPKDADVLLAGKIEIPVQYQKEYAQKVYTLEQLIFSAQYHAQEGHQQLAAYVAQSTAREAAMLTAINALAQSSGVGVTPETLKAMIDSSVENALATLDLRLVAGPTVGGVTT